MSKVISNPVFSRQDGARNPAQVGPSGFLAVAKPSGMTSFDVIRELRRLLRVKKMGHSGVLDKPASGVLVVGLNRATRLFEFFSGMEKEYTADVWLGLSTATDDLSGEIIARADSAPAVERGQFETALARYVGEFDQLPPAFSLTKKDGKELYRYALAGETVEVDPKRVEISASRVLEYESGVDPREALGAQGGAGLPPLTRARISVACRGGVYIRSLARDLGADLGVPGCLGYLLRTRVGRFTLEDSLSLEEIEQRMAAGERPGDLLAPLSSIATPEECITLDQTQLRLVQSGRAIGRRWQQLSDALRTPGALAYGLAPGGDLCAVLRSGLVSPEGVCELRPVKVLG